MAHDAQFLTDFITGRPVPDIGAEANRQAVEKMLVNHKGYLKTDIQPDCAIAFEVAGEPYRSHIDLLVRVNGVAMMLFKCAAGSLGSREREVVAAARIIEALPIPIAVVSDGDTAVVMATMSGRRIGEGWNAVPSRDEMMSHPLSGDRSPLSADRMEKERLIFRTYDIANVNRIR